MNRRDFFIRSSLVASAAVLPRSLSFGQTATPPAAQTPPASSTTTPSTPATPPAPTVTAFTPLRRDVGIFTGRGGTIGWLANSAALVAVDTQFPDTAAKFLEGLPGRSGRNLDVVINTHHHGDHTAGNLVLKPATQHIVAHANVPELQRQRAEQAKTLDQQVYANMTFTDTWRLALGGETIQARYFGPGHTKGDIIVTFEQANVVHMGDLMFNRVYPVIDRPGGASIRAWMKILEKVAAEYPADAIYVFGHSNPKFSVTGIRSDLLILRDYFTGLLEYTQRQIAAGKPKSEIIALENLPGFPDFSQPLPNRLGINLSVAYDELTSA